MACFAEALCDAAADNTKTEKADADFGCAHADVLPPDVASGKLTVLSFARAQLPPMGRQLVFPHVTLSYSLRSVEVRNAKSHCWL